eukprot:39090-Eustigmatos_ZCMA.PRE.1
MAQMAQAIKEGEAREEFVSGETDASISAQADLRRKVSWSVSASITWRRVGGSYRAHILGR